MMEYKSVGYDQSGRFMELDYDILTDANNRYG